MEGVPFQPGVFVFAADRAEKIGLISKSLFVQSGHVVDQIIYKFRAERLSSW
jgi:hypothetical protein